MDKTPRKAQSVKRYRFSLPKLPRIQKKYIGFGFIGIVVVIGLIWYVTPYVQQFFAGLNPPIEASLIPEKEEVYVDEEFQVSMRLSGRKASALELFLTYDSTIVSYATEYGETTGFSQVTQDYFISPLIEEIIPSSEEGKKKLHLLIVSQKGQLDAVQFNLRFKALEEGKANFITDVESRVAGPSDDETATYFDLPEDVSTIVTVIGLSDDPGTCACTDGSVSDDNCNEGFVPICTEDTGTLCSCTATTPTPSESIMPSPSGDPNTPTPSTAPNDTPTPTPDDIDPTVTQTPTQPAGGERADVELKLKIKFQGVTKQPSEAYRQLNTKVILAAADKSFREESTIPFIADGEGLWSGTFSAKNVPLGAKYAVFIKGPKHLKKKICDAAPSESVAGSYKCSTEEIGLKAGAQDIDFSKIVLLVGDIPIQDGIIDSVDAVYVRNNFGSQTASSVSRADLNLDGIVHTQDMVLMLKALEFKYDED